jgi:adenylate kinase
MIVLLFGPPGVGKGTQAELLTKRYQLTVCSTGNILRDEIAQQSELGNTVKQYLEQGELVPDHHLFTLIERFIDSRRKEHMLFDGFPRNLNQATVLDKLLAKADLKLDIALELHMSEDEIVKRLVHRRYCSTCGRTYNLLTNPPQNENCCNDCGTALTQRTDDTETVIRTRMHVYAKETQPLIDYYKERKIYHQISARGTQNEIFERIMRFFNGNID